MSEKRNWKHFAMELILIVVGINLGLFVNNLNEQRKETKLERQLLSELKTCLEGDLKDVNVNIKIHKTGAYSGQKVLDHLKKEPIDSFAFHLSRTHSWSFFVNNTSTFESLKSIGFGIIKNDEIRQKITELYNVDYRLIYEFEQLHNKLKWRWDEIFETNMGSDWQKSDDNQIIKNLKKIENFEFFINRLTMSNYSINRTYDKRIKPKLRELITLIEKELE